MHPIIKLDAGDKPTPKGNDPFNRTALLPGLIEDLQNSNNNNGTNYEFKVLLDYKLKTRLRILIQPYKRENIVVYNKYKALKVKYAILPYLELIDISSSLSSSGASAPFSSKKDWFRVYKNNYTYYWLIKSLIYIENQVIVPCLITYLENRQIVPYNIINKKIITFSFTYSLLPYYELKQLRGPTRLNRGVAEGRLRAIGAYGAYISAYSK
ncbi:hypothetical protein NEUTE2DRAFT_122751 [Neurospora tetrasperma FGSC 2509]|nr:hypothetical protein NEUTE2DRAFT_122751 [Neurospora tetrasperma FGSC 2509]